MVKFQLNHVWAGMCVVLSSCIAIDVTRHQKEELEHRAAHHVKDIISVVGEIKQPLFETYLRLGGWLALESNSNVINESVTDELDSHEMELLRVVPVDSEELLLELGILDKGPSRLPLMMSSWVLVFSCHAENKTTELISLLPVWREPATIAKGTSYTPELIEKYQAVFKELLNDKLALQVLDLSAGKSQNGI